jgi:hypothetical protein
MARRAELHDLYRDQDVNLVYDPELEQAALIKREREQAQAQKVGMEVHLLALEVQRRQALFAAGTLAPFQPAPATTVVA